MFPALLVPAWTCCLLASLAQAVICAPAEDLAGTAELLRLQKGNLFKGLAFELGSVKLDVIKARAILPTAYA